MRIRVDFIGRIGGFVGSFVVVIAVFVIVVIGSIVVFFGILFRIWLRGDRNFKGECLCCSRGNSCSELVPLGRFVYIIFYCGCLK